MSIIKFFSQKNRVQQNLIHKLISKNDVIGVVKLLEANPKHFFDQLNELLISRTVKYADLKAFNLYWTQNYSFHEKCLKFAKPFAQYCDKGLYKTDSFTFDGQIAIENLQLPKKSITYMIPSEIIQTKEYPLHLIKVLY